MLTFRIFLLLFIITGLARAQEAQELSLIPAVELEATSMDSSESIIVKGSENKIRSRILSMAMEAREATYSKLGLNENTQEHTLEINLYGKLGENPPERLSKKTFLLAAGRPVINLDLHLAKGVNESELEKDLTELFMYEISMRELDFKRDDDLALKLPAWLTHGMLEAIRWDDDKVDRQLYAKLYKQEAIYQIEDLLEEDAQALDQGIMNHAFRVSSGVLVMALLNQPQGKEGLYAMVKEAASYKGEQKLLISKHFPDTTLSKNSLAKWWALQLLTMSKRPAENLYNITESHTALQKVLTIELTDSAGNVEAYEPLNYLEIKKYPAIVSSTKVTRVINELSILQTKVFPSYRPLIGGYQQSLLRVIQGPKKKSFWDFFSKEDEDKMSVTEMLIRLEKERSILEGLGIRVTDYLNWYQLEQADAQSGAFDDYLQLKKDLETQSVSDDGPLSQYLDDMQELYKRD